MTKEKKKWTETIPLARAMELSNYLEKRWQQGEHRWYGVWAYIVEHEGSPTGFVMFTLCVPKTEHNEYSDVNEATIELTAVKAVEVTTTKWVAAP